jgi:hypothetical protein
MIMSIDEVRKHVVDGDKMAALIGIYATPSGNAVITAEKDGPGWGVVSLRLTIGDKSIIIGQDIVERNLVAGRMTKIA